MVSLIQNASDLGLQYSTYSLTVRSDNNSPDKVFVDDTTFFLSNDSPNNQWWQISFTKPVAIDSYTIKSSSNYNHRPKSWIISTSFDNSTWTDVDLIFGKDTTGNTEIFTLHNVVNCKHFRIILKENTNSNILLKKINIFGKRKKRNK